MAVQPASRPSVPASAPELSFAVRDAEPERFAAFPALRFELDVVCAGGGRVQSIVLAIQIRIAATRRGYGTEEQERLAGLFGAPQDWGRNLHSLLWTNTTVVVPPFEGSTTVSVTVPCTYDLEVTAARYLQSLQEGEIPLEFLFGGTVFYPTDQGLQTTMVPWSSEASYRLPVATWKRTMDLHFPDSAWMRLDRETFDRLHAYRSRRALTSWEATLDELLGGG